MKIKPLDSNRREINVGDTVAYNIYDKVVRLGVVDRVANKSVWIDKHSRYLAGNTIVILDKDGVCVIEK